MNLNDRISELYSDRSLDLTTGEWSGITKGGTGLFGNFSKSDEATFNRQMAEAQTLADIAIMDYQNDFNSPSAQAKRMREAGLNPDLIGVDSNQSADASASGASAPLGVNNTEVVATVASTVMSAFNSAMAVVNGIQSFKSAQESIAGQQIDNLNKMDGFAMDFILSSVRPDSFTEDDANNEAVISDLITSSRSWAQKVYGFNRKQSRIFQDSVTRRVKDPRFRENFYKSLANIERDRQDYISKTTGDLYHSQDETMRIMLDEIIRMQNAVYKSGLSSSQQEFDYNRDVFDNLSGSSFADYQNMSNVNATADLRSAYYEKSFGRNIRKRLYNSYKHGNIFSGLALSFLPSLNLENTINLAKSFL